MKELNILILIFKENIFTNTVHSSDVRRKQHNMGPITGDLFSNTLYHTYMIAHKLFTIPLADIIVYYCLNISTLTTTVLYSHPYLFSVPFRASSHAHKYKRIMINVSLWSSVAGRSVASLQIGRIGPTATLIDHAIR